MEAETTIRRHHLIDEAKSELDVAYDEVSTAESQIIDYNSLRYRASHE